MDLEQRLERFEDALVEVSVLALPDMPMTYVGVPERANAHRKLVAAVEVIKAERT